MPEKKPADAGTPEPTPDAPAQAPAPETRVLATRDHLTQFVLPRKGGDVVVTHDGTRVAASEAAEITETAFWSGVVLEDVTDAADRVEALKRAARAQLPTPEKD